MLSYCATIGHEYPINKGYIIHGHKIYKITTAI